MKESYKIAVVGSGPAGLSAAAHAAELGLSYVLLEAEGNLSNTLFRYQKGKHVMAEPAVLPLRSALPFGAGKREQILDGWREGVERLQVELRMRAGVTAIQGQRGEFVLTLAGGARVRAEVVVLAIGLQGNLRKLGVPGEDLPYVQYQLDDPDEYQDESIVVIGGGDAGIENALALADHNQVTILNRDTEFTRAKEANNAAILKMIGDGQMQCFYGTATAKVEAREGRPRLTMTLNTPKGPHEFPCDRVIARLGAMPPRKFVEACGVVFPSQDANSVPAVSPMYQYV